jgi:23S rRNA (cytosine1962-C5)-methyltransferase
MQTVILKPRRSAPFAGHHPWLFSGALDQVSGSPLPGDSVKVCDEDGKFLAYGLYNSHSQIRVRLYSFQKQDILTDVFWHDKVTEAINLREEVLGFKPLPDNAYRLINSEGDGLSGLTADRYGDYLVVQFTSKALYTHKDILFKALIDLTHPIGIILRTEADILSEEGLELKDGLIWGEQPFKPLLIKENGVSFEVNLSTGQKTGFYLDQRANRTLLERFTVGKTVLDLCSYTGGFALHAAKAGAISVTAVDVSASALEQAQRNAVLNGFEQIEFVKSDMFKWLDKCLAEDRSYDVVILDPPKMTHSKGSVQSALKGYLQLNASALKCLNPGGVMLTCSCSGRISRDDFLFTLHRAALVAGKTLRILEVRGADIDHPVLTSCPESGYLKCVVCYAE